MGIKFRCPNGHKLNVKAFLAGKRGVCPKCGTSMRIPLESTRDRDADLPADEGEGDDLLDEARFPAPGRAASGTRTAAAARENVPSAVAVAAPVAIPVAAPIAADPIGEAPAAVWYVRPPSGDQYGPARGDVMRRWIAEGRVSTDSLVWREGWADWLSASDVFPSLKSASAPPPTPPSASAPAKNEVPAAPASEPAMPARSTRLTSRYEAKRKQGSGLGIAVIIFLGLLCVVLAALLVYVFVFASSGPTGSPTKSASIVPLTTCV